MIVAAAPFTTHLLGDSLRMLVVVFCLIAIWGVARYGRVTNPTVWWWLGALVLFAVSAVYSQFTRLGQPVSPRLPLALAASLMAAIAATRSRRATQ